MNLKQASLLTIPLLCLAFVGPAAVAQEDSGDTGSSGGFSYRGGAANGTHVSFQFDEATGTVCGWSIQGHEIIDEIAWDDFSAEVQLSGGVFAAHDGAASTNSSSDTATSTTTDTNTTGTNTTTTTSATNATTGTSSTSTANATTNATSSTSATTNTTAPAAPEGIECPLTENVTAATETANGTPTTGPPAGTPAGTPAAPSAVKIHDVRSGLIKLELRGSEHVVWDFQDNLSLEQEDDWTVWVRGDGFEAVLWTDHSAHNDGLHVMKDQVELTSRHHANVMWRVFDIDEAEDAGEDEALEDAIARAIVQGLVSTEIDVDGGNSVAGDFSNSTGAVTIVQENRVDVFIQIDIDIGQTVAPNATTTSSSTDTSTNATNTTTDTSTNVTSTTTNTTSSLPFTNTTTSSLPLTNSTTTATATFPPATNTSTTATLPPPTNTTSTAAPANGTTAAPTSNASQEQPVTLILIQISQDQFQGQDQIVVLLDDRPLADTDDVDDAVTIDDGEAPEALLLRDADGGLLALASVPNGAHKLSVLSQPAAAEGSDAIPGVGAVAALGLVAVAALVVRRRLDL